VPFAAEGEAQVFGGPDSISDARKKWRLKWRNFVALVSGEGVGVPAADTRWRRRSKVSTTQREVPE
jgi:hypothetical protein